MNNIADVVLEYYWFLNFCSDDELDPHAAVNAMEQLVYKIENEFSNSEKLALQDAAKRSLESRLREPDEHGYTPRTLLTPDGLAFLQAIIEGNFSGPPIPEADV